CARVYGNYDYFDYW
nr:immunoglobulin heavy chain junction region [Mus musculus]